MLQRCGTGELTLMLTQAGYDMIGIDQSEEMLCVVRDKAEQLGLSGKLLLLQQDLLKLDLYGTIRGAVSTFDTFNHIPDLDTAIANAAFFMEEGGGTVWAEVEEDYGILILNLALIGEVGRLLKRGAPKRDANGKVIKGTDGKPIYQPYVIKVLNTINFSKSLHYNPFAYIKSEKDILKLVTVIMANTKGEGEKENQDFWYKAERLLYTALIAYIWYEGSEEEKNFSTLLDLLNESEVREDDEEYQNPVDLLFEELEEKEPEHFAVRQYRKYKLAAGKTAKSILVSCGARLAPFDIAELREIMSYDEMELDMIGDRLTALFLIMSDTDTIFNFVIAMLQSQLFNLLCDKADDVYGGRLPIHVRVICDEFANTGKIPNMDKLIATIRSREISASIILQSQSQLKTMYQDAADTLVGNCDTTLFLGGKEKSTLKEISEILGKETIDLYNTSETRSNQKSYGLNYQKLGKQLMTEDEIAVMDGGKCILQIRGARPFFSDKYDITKHPNYRYLSDADPKNWFRPEIELNPQYVPKPEEEVEVTEIDLTQESE